MHTVYVIESPGPEDLYAGRYEGQYVFDLVERCGADCRYKVVYGPEQLEAALTEAEDYLYDEESELILHLSCHGDADGLELLGGDLIEWEDLAQRIKNHFGGKSKQVKVVLSSCSSGGIDTWCAFAKHVPWALMVGAISDVEWSESMTAMSVFYFRVLRDEFDGLQDFMNNAVGTDNWIVRAT